MYTSTVKCYSSSLVFHWLDLRQEKQGPGLAFSCSMKYGGRLVLGPGALPVSDQHPGGKLLALAQVIGVQQYT